MGFLSKIISGFKTAAQAGEEFNPALDAVIKKLEELHAQGKLDDTLYQAEQAFEAEHKAYQAKGDATNAEDSKNETAAMTHFIAALSGAVDKLDPSVQGEVKHLIELKDQMMNILGNAFK